MIGVNFGKSFEAETGLIGFEVCFSLEEYFAVHAEAGVFFDGTAGGGQYVFGVAGAAAYPFSVDIFKKHFLFVTGNIVLVIAFGFVVFFPFNIHGGAGNGVVFIDSISDNFGILEGAHATPGFDFDVAGFGVDKGVGRFDHFHASNFEQVGTHVVNRGFSFKTKAVSIWVGGNKHRGFVGIGFKNDGLFFHIPVKLVHGSHVLVEWEGGVGIGGIGFEAAGLGVKIQLTIHVFGVKSDTTAVDGFNLKVGGIGSCLEGSVSDQFGTEFALGPFKDAFSFQTRRGQDQNAFMEIAGLFEERKVFFFTFYVHGIAERQPVYFYVLAFCLWCFYGTGAVFFHIKPAGGSGGLFGSENKIFGVNIGSQVAQGALSEQSFVAEVNFTFVQSFTGVGGVAGYRGGVHIPEGFIVWA